MVMSAERLAELRDRVHRTGHLAPFHAQEALEEIERLHAELSAVQSWSRGVLRRYALSEPGPLVPDAPGWWWAWSDARERWEPHELQSWRGVLHEVPSCSPASAVCVRWGGRCEEPR